ncbi:ribose-5-phosphate isomerase rki1, partial [Rhizopus stolonifer]
MDLCCARVSDKSLEYLELYPQEFSHRSLYDFLIPGESQQTLSRLHRCLLDNAAQHQKSKQPTNYIRSSFEKFFSFSLEPLLNIANGSLTLKQTLKFRYGRDSSKTEEMNCRFYLGGGFGADLFDSHGLDQLYIVCVISPTKTNLSPTLTNTNTTAFNAHILSTTTDHLTSNIPHNMNDMIHLPPLIINNNDSSSTLSSSVSPTTTSLTVLEETEPTKETLEEAENSNNSNKMSSPVMMKRTVSNNNNNTIHLPLISSSPNYENTKNKSLLDRFRYNTQSRSQQFIHPNELYYLKTTSSRLSSEAIAHTAYPYLSKASSNTTGSGPLASYNKGKKLAAYRAVDEYINADQKVVGIGSGSTVVYVVERILQRPELKHIVYIPTSFQSKILILEGGLQLGSIEQHPEIDVTIDGADEVDEDLNAIKGGGACQFQEKVIAEAAKKFVIVA